MIAWRTTMNRNDIIGGAFVAALLVAFFGGLFLWFWFDNGWYALGPVLALILAAAG